MSSPTPHPPLRHTALADLSFATLGWLHRAARAAGSDRFAETALRARFYLDKSAGYATTPADDALITGLASALDALVRADVNARQVLGEAMSAVDDDVAARFAASPQTEEGT